MSNAKNRTFYGLAVFALISSACGLSGNVANNNAEADQVASEAEPTEDSSQLDCGGTGYPCSYNDSDPSALSRANELLDEAAEMVGKSGETASVAAYLEGLDEVVEVYSDPRAIFFRVKDAAPMIVLHPDFGPDYSGLTSQIGSAPKLASPVLPAPAFSDDGPIGPQDEGQEPKKKALLLSLFLWDFGFDEVDDIAAKLANHRDYDCGDCVEVVTIAENPLENLTGQFQVGPGVENFLGWQQYDLIHIVTHGDQICGSNINPGCVTILNTGGFRHEQTLVPGGQNRPYPGVYYGASSKLPEGWRIEYVTADFFRSQYPSGLSDTLIFFSACETTTGSDFFSVFAGSNTAILGWRGSPRNGPAAEIALKFYDFLIDDGLRAKVAYDKTISFGGFATGIGSGEDQVDADLLIKGADEPRGREVVTLIHPFRRTDLETGDTITTQGNAGDGINDALFIAARVEGIDENQAPGDFIVHLSINGREIDATLKPETKLDDYSYRTDMIAIPLPIDVDNQESITLEAWIDLPEGGQTRHFLEMVYPVGCGWSGIASSGPLSGNEVINTHDASLNDDEVRQLLQQSGMDGSMTGPAAGNPLVIVMGTDSLSGFPIITASDSGGSISLSPRDVYGTQSLHFDVINIGDGLYGTVSGSYRGASGPMTYIGDFYWHPDSRCSFAIKVLAGN